MPAPPLDNGLLQLTPEHVGASWVSAQTSSAPTVAPCQNQLGGYLLCNHLAQFFSFGCSSFSYFSCVEPQKLRRGSFRPQTLVLFTRIGQQVEPGESDCLGRNNHSVLADAHSRRCCRLPRVRRTSRHERRRRESNGRHVPADVAHVG